MDSQRALREAVRRLFVVAICLYVGGFAKGVAKRILKIEYPKFRVTTDFGDSPPQIYWDLKIPHESAIEIWRGTGK